jgi:hypothetical protein
MEQRLELCRGKGLTWLDVVAAASTVNPFQLFRLDFFDIPPVGVPSSAMERRSR